LHFRRRGWLKREDRIARLTLSGFDIAGARQWPARAARSMLERSRRLVRALLPRMETVIVAWLFLFGAAAAIRMALSLSPVENAADFAAIFLPYGLAALAPIAGYRLTMAAFPAGLLPAQAGFRLARVGRWLPLGALEARKHPAFGPAGFMASLLIGMLLNVPVRSFEFLLAVPAMNHHAPQWGTTLFHLMALDLIAMNFLYAVCFAMALRSVPLFPRMLAFTWFMDLFLQLSVARGVAASPDLPITVAAALQELLTGNVTKVLISAGIWLPYLLLSERVNVTYRSRLPAS
jgi:hypothetical protein